MLRIDGISKRFGALLANDAISLTLAQGEILGLLGENGAGKSTLVSILFGHYVADAGSIEAFGKPLPAGDPAAALSAGVGMVHQHFTLAENLTVLENVMLGTEPLTRPISRRAAARARLLETAARFGLAVDADARVADLSVGERQRVEILKVLYRGARLLILDEPTAVLTPHESEALFASLSGMVANGMSIILISHKLAEVLRVADRIAVLRAGKLIGQAAARDTTAAELARWMVGREVAPPRKRPAPPVEAGEPALSLERLSISRRAAHGLPALTDVSLQVARGEFLALAGVAGNGQQTLAHALFGLVQPDAGTIVIGRARAPTAGWTPRAVRDAGAALIPEDRGAMGVVGELQVWENACAEALDRPPLSRFGVIARGAARRFAQDIVERFDVRTTGLTQATRSLSGGNMQKLILGRALSSQPELIVAQQPSWGLDIGAVEAVHARLLEAAARGAGVLLISEDLDEILALADRIAVMHAGRVVAVRPTAQWDSASLGAAMAGHALA